MVSQPLSWSACSKAGQLFWWTTFSAISSKPPLAQLETLSSCPQPCCQREETDTLLLGSCGDLTYSNGPPFWKTTKDKTEHTILGLHTVKKYFHIHRSYKKWTKAHLFHLDSPQGSVLLHATKPIFKFPFQAEEKNKGLLAWSRFSSSHAHPSLF